MDLFRGNTVQQLFPVLSRNLSLVHENEQKYSDEGSLLHSVMELKNTPEELKLPKHVYAMLKARYFLARGDYIMAGKYARRVIEHTPSYATGWCYLAEIYAKQHKCKYL